MDMSAQVSRMCQSAYFQLHDIAKIRHCLTVNACKTIVHAHVTSKLDYGNAVLFGINERLINKLQMTQKSAALRGMSYRTISALIDAVVLFKRLKAVFSDYLYTGFRFCMSNCQVMMLVFIDIYFVLYLYIFIIIVNYRPMFYLMLFDM